MAETNVRWPQTRCMGCKKPIDSWSNDTEVWHEPCYQKHRKALRKSVCNEHRLCIKANE